MAYKIKITTRKNIPVTKTLQVDDPNAKVKGTKTTISYQTYEWQDVSTSNEISLPKNTQTLKMLSDIASASGWNTDTKTLDSNIRYIVEILESMPEDPPAEGTSEHYWFRSTCGNVVFESQAINKLENKTEYRCPYCNELLAFKQS